MKALEGALNVLNALDNCLFIEEVKGNKNVSIVFNTNIRADLQSVIAGLEVQSLKLEEHKRLHQELCNIIFKNEEQPKSPSLCDLIAYVQSDYKKLQALQQQNCGNCTHSLYWESADILECTKITKQRCYQCEEDLDMTEVTGDFYCNRYEKREKL